MKRIGQNRLEWALLGLIALACAGLSLLQYQWTGEVSRAERARLRAALNDQAGRLIRAFDDELRENCRALLPDATEIREEGAREAHTSRYRQWAASHDRALLARIGVVVPEHGALLLYGIDFEGRMNPMPWPPEWLTLRTVHDAPHAGRGSAAGGSGGLHAHRIPDRRNLPSP